MAGCRTPPPGADLLDPPGVHDDDAVGDLERLLLVVGDEGRVTRSSSWSAQPAAQLLAHPRVERAERLVEQQHARLQRQRARQRDALALAAGELRRVAAAEAVELDQVEQLARPASRICAFGGRSPAADAQAEGDVLEDGHVAEQGVVLEHEADAALAGRQRRSTSSPSKRTAPASGTSSPAMMRSSVVLPEPDGPSSATSSPAGTSRLTSSSAVNAPNALARRLDLDAHVRPLLGLASCSASALDRVASDRERRAPAASGSTRRRTRPAYWYSL